MKWNKNYMNFITYDHVMIMVEIKIFLKVIKMISVVVNTQLAFTVRA